MHELVLVVISVLTLSGIGMPADTASPTSMAEVGLLCLAAGLVLGLPGGFRYHYRLYQVLAGKGPVPGTWWFSPSDFHSELAPQELALIRPWYLFGAMSFAVALAGGLVALGGLLVIHPG